MGGVNLGLREMRPRDPDEPHRVASPLELFFDLVFVVAVSLSSAALHHEESGGHVGAGVGSYLMVFFGIWWAWMNFTWFASAFDVDDWLYRATTLVQMAGALVMAAGTPSAMAGEGYGVLVAGYVVMRLAMVTQWLRAARSHPALRTTALRYAGGIAVVQLLWIAGCSSPRTRCGSSCWHWPSWRSRWSPSVRGRRRGTRTTSPSATACSP
nr:low temperature requirement protein A [Pseudonocardia sp. ICBG601]